MSADETTNVPKASKKRKMSVAAADAADAARFQVLDQREHLLKRPDMVLGSTERAEHYDVRVYDAAANAMRYATVRYSAALVQVVQEILSNAADRPARGDCTTLIEVSIPPPPPLNGDAPCEPIVVRNNGNGIPIVRKTLSNGEQCWVPELCFGRFMAGENFDDDETRWNVGRNGIGATACNVYSRRFEVTVRDPARQQQFKQHFADNMSTKSVARVTKCSAKQGLVELKLWPDYARFGYEDGRLDEPTRSVLMARVVDMAACVGAAGVKVKLNGALLPVKSMQHLADLLFGADRAAVPRFYYKQVDAANERVVRLEMVIAHASQQQQQQQQQPHVGFVNGVPCNAGKHVQYILERVADATLKHFKSKRASTRDQIDASSSVSSSVLDNAQPFCDYGALRPAMLKNNMALLISVTVDNPSFKSQSKEELATPMSKWGFSVALPDNVPAHMQRLGIVRSAMAEAAAAQQKALSRAMAANGGLSGAPGGATNARGRRPDVPKLDDAHCAGKRGEHNVLVLIEGDSAKEMAVAGLSATLGKNNFGVFPFRGKLLNLRKASVAQLRANRDVQALCKILGAAPGDERVRSPADLRYQQVFMLTDSDPDGGHIVGLIVNALQCLWPRVALDPKFFVRFRTPVRLATLKHKPRATGNALRDNLFFLTERDYERWLHTGAVPAANLVDEYEREDDSHWANDVAPVHDGLGNDAAAERLRRYRIAYLKGLGSSTSTMAIRYFRYLRRFVVHVDCSTAVDLDVLDMAFSDKRKEERKRWVDHFDPRCELNYDADSVPFRDLATSELAGFAFEHCARVIPALVDGLKPVQRKVLYAMMTKRRPFVDEKVVIVLGDVIKRAAYHHGETSLFEAIVQMAQCHVGTNNVNFLHPSGQFGSRLAERSVHSAARYISTRLERVAEALFLRADFPVLRRAVDDGVPVEFCHFVPVLPTVLFNGAEGIGTGYATTLHPYHPIDTVSALTRCAARAYCAFVEQCRLQQQQHANDPAPSDDADQANEVVPNDASRLFSIGSRGFMSAEQRSAWCLSGGNVDAGNAASLEEPVPWFDLFCGTVERAPNDSRSFIMRGKFERLADGEHVRVTELPIGEWKDTWKTAVLNANRYVPGGTVVTVAKRKRDAPTAAAADADDEAKDERGVQDEEEESHAPSSAAQKKSKKATAARGFIVDVERDDSTHVAVDVLLRCDCAQLAALDDAALRKALRLEKVLSTANMVLWNADGRLASYDSVHRIVREFAMQRHYCYELRRDYALAKLAHEHRALLNKHRFAQAVVDGSIDVRNRTAEDIVAQCEKAGVQRSGGAPFVWHHPDEQNQLHEFDSNANDENGGEADEQDGAARDNDDDDNKNNDNDAQTTSLDARERYDGYDYLLRQGLSTLTKANLQRLQARCQQIETEIDALRAQTVLQTWERELSAFEAEYQAFVARKDDCLQAHVVASANQKPAKKIKKRAAQKGKRVSNVKR